MRTINPVGLVTRLNKAVTKNRPVMIWGSPGIGKSDIPRQVAESRGIGLLDFRANLFDPVDVRGVPYVRQIKDTGKRFTSWAVPDVFHIPERDGERGILFIDELPASPPATQNAFLQLILDRRVGDYELPSGWTIVAAGNRLTDGASVYQMTSALRNRFAHFELEPTLDDWVTWAHQNDINTDVIGFIQYRPQLLNSFDADEYAFPTPRTWAMVSNHVDNTTDDEEGLFFDVASLVGDGPAGEFVAFKEIANKLPNIDEVIQDPSKYKKDDNPALLYAFANALAARADDDKMESIMKLAKKIPLEFQVVLVRSSIAAGGDDVRKHNDVRKWVKENANVVL